MRGIAGELKAWPGITIIDMEAGLENFGRGTPAAADLLLVVAEPAVWSVATAKRILEMAKDLGIPQMAIVANKIVDRVDEEWIREALAPTGVDVIGVVPYDPNVSKADRRMRSLLDMAPETDAVKAIAGIVDGLEAVVRAHEAPTSAKGHGAASGEATGDDGCPWVVDK